MKKWHYILIALACFTLVGLLIWWSLKRKKAPKELSPQLKQLEEKIEQEKIAKDQQAKANLLDDPKVETLKKELADAKEELAKIKNDPVNNTSKVVKINKQGYKQPPNTKPLGNQLGDENTKKEAPVEEKKSKKGLTEAETLAYQKAKNADTIEAYEQFKQGSYGSKRYFGYATRRINQLKKLKKD